MTSEWHIAIDGIRIISGKNHMQPKWVRGKMILVGSDAYQRNKIEIDNAIRPYRPTEPLRGPVHVDMALSCKGKMKIDLDNALSNIFDSLARNRIIEDDDMIVSSRQEKSGGHPDWRIEIAVWRVVENDDDWHQAVASTSR